MTNEVTTGLADVVVRIDAARRRRAETHRSHLLWMDENKRTIDELEHQRDLLAGSSMTSDQIELARSVVEVGGRISESAGGAFEDALTAVAEGGTRLLGYYVGAKRYDGFHQRSDHDYGTGPSHGSIVFSVGLTRDVRLWADQRVGEPLSLAEREAAVAYLLAEKRLSDERTRVARRW